MTPILNDLSWEIKIWEVYLLTNYLELYCILTFYFIKSRSNIQSSEFIILNELNQTTTINMNAARL